MQLRHLSQADEPVLRSLMMHAPSRNLFHLSALVEWGLPPAPDPYAPLWAVGAFRGGELVGAVAALRGTGGIYHLPGDSDTLQALAPVAVDRSLAGSLSLLSGHESQVGALLPLLRAARPGHIDRCHFRTLRPADLATTFREVHEGFAAPRPATESDMERLIDFYIRGFYSLAHLPSRAAWHNRLVEQLRYRTLFLVEDREGKVASAAMSSAESAGGAMLGGIATLPEYEGQGLSTLCVGTLCAYLFKQRGMPLISLFFLKDNTRPARVYEKLGFQPDGEWLLASLGGF